MRVAWLVAAVALVGCVTPRSMVVGQMAAPVGRGATEVGVYGGVLYGAQTDPIVTGTDTSGTQYQQQQVSSIFAAPGAEANIQHGFDDHFALNVHASSAGVQPGLKWTINESRIAHVALLPAVGLGYASYATKTLQYDNQGIQTAELVPTTVTSFTFLGGLKVLVSHRSGFFAGVGYDFLFNRSVNTVDQGTSATGGASRTTTTTLSHQISASAGFDIALGMVHLRPEVAFAAYPGLNKTVTILTPPMAEYQVPGSGRGGFGWAIFPGFTIAIATPPRELTDDEKEEVRAKARVRRKSDPVTDDDDDDDDAQQQHRRPTKRPATDDDDRPRKRKPADDDDDRMER